MRVRCLIQQAVSLKKQSSISVVDRFLPWPGHLLYTIVSACLRTSFDIVTCRTPNNPPTYLRLLLTLVNDIAWTISRDSNYVCTLRIGRPSFIFCQSKQDDSPWKHMINVKRENSIFKLLIVLRNFRMQSTYSSRKQLIWLRAWQCDKTETKEHYGNDLFFVKKVCIFSLHFLWIMLKS